MKTTLRTRFVTFVKGNRLILFGGIPLVVLACCLFSFLLTLLPAPPTATPSVEQVVLVVTATAPPPTETSTAPPTATATRVPPTKTKAPPTATATKVPPTETPAAEPTLDAEVLLAYTGHVSGYSAQLARKLDEFTKLNNEAVDNAVLLFDPDHRDKMRAVVRDMADLSQKMADYDPVPKEFTETHRWLVKVAAEYAAMEEDYVIWLDDFDVDALNRAADHVRTANSYLGFARDELREAFPGMVP